MVSMNQLSIEKRAMVVRALVEGCSIRSIVRMTGVSKNTIAKLLPELGAACSTFLDERLRGLKCERIQCDEIWSFVYAKQKNVANAAAAPDGAGDAWTWTALDSSTKLLITWRVGLRSANDALEFMLDLSGRITNWAQLTTDGFGAYPAAVKEAFGDEISYAQLIKIYRQDRTTEATYSPAKCCGTEKKHVCGAPDPEHISTSHVERHNLTMRMSIRRFTRLTNAFSKKIENHAASVALHAAYYNFCRIHETLRVTPAMAAGVAKRVYEVDDLIRLLDGEIPV